MYTTQLTWMSLAALLASACSAEGTLLGEGAPCPEEAGTSICGQVCPVSEEGRACVPAGDAGLRANCVDETWVCTSVQDANACVELGVVHPDGDSWKCADGCNDCSCHGGDTRSTTMACLPPGDDGDCIDPDSGDTYGNGASWECADGCNTCGCEAGEIWSTLMACVPASGACLDSDTGIAYEEGEAWACNGCNTCSCVGGDVQSTLLPCPPPLTDGSCLDPDTGTVHLSGDQWDCADGCGSCGCDSGQLWADAMVCAGPNDCTEPDTGIIHFEGEEWACGSCTTCSCAGGKVTEAPLPC